MNCIPGGLGIDLLRDLLLGLGHGRLLALIVVHVLNASVLEVIEVQDEAVELIFVDGRVDYHFHSTHVVIRIDVLQNDRVTDLRFAAVVEGLGGVLLITCHGGKDRIVLEAPELVAVVIQSVPCDLGIIINGLGPMALRHNQLLLFIFLCRMFLHRTGLHSGIRIDFLVIP